MRRQLGVNICKIRKSVNPVKCIIRQNPSAICPAPLQLLKRQPHTGYSTYSIGYACYLVSEVHNSNFPRLGA